ncbi:Dyp-type peroxidase [Nocardia alni]|uniref:Dyp-type peroxidase n=1 Tax=Nocardia alni TaxID=2815723 RepID=UPI001C22EA82|nr:Dyp-type peroxidase [Nocardia alni]
MTERRDDTHGSHTHPAHSATDDANSGRPSVGRRSFLRNALAVTGAGGAAAVAAACDSRPAATADPATAEAAVPAFHGARQAGIAEQAPPGSQTIMTSFDVIAADRGELTDLMRTLTDQARRLCSGGLPAAVGITGPPSDSGVLGPDVPGGELTATVGVGATLFDDRFGLATQRPTGLTTMPTFPNDNLQTPWCHGDLSLQLTAADADTCVHALREITRATRGAMQPRWRMNGFISPRRPQGTPRNLFGFKDGIANPAPAEFDHRIWVAGNEPAWTAGGTYQVVRLIRMLVEFWDRVDILEQENMFGRARDTGAPLSGNQETDDPDYTNDPEGMVIPLTAHIRLANPRTSDTDGSRILRRAFNYDRGTDAVGNLDQGLIFLAYQRDVRDQFEAVQHRLKDEPLVDYISPFGGGYFFILPGVRDEKDFYGRALLT